MRHGESLANTGGTPMPNTDIPLTQNGHTQAIARLTHWLSLNMPKPHLSLCHVSHTADRLALLSALWHNT
ncbi:MAG: phosphoglycerate mutase family protein [Moraxella sp.]|nr:phosphoglycerate mutase family protein [Moraxella sp.]